jgi:hypothetical protein
MRFFSKNIQKKSGNTCKYEEYDHYGSLDFITVFCFFMVASTGDYRYILKLDDYEKLPEDADLAKLEKVWTNINTEFEATDGTNETIIYFTRSKSVHNMELEYLMLWNLHTLLCVAPNHEITKESFEYAGIKPDAKKIHKRLKALSNRIELKRSDLKEVSEPTEKLDVWEIIAMIEDFKGRNIDVHTKTMRQYVAMKKTIKNGRKRQDNAEGRN